jgi:UNC-50 family
MDAPHARKSRLTVPVGGDSPLSPTQNSRTSVGGTATAAANTAASNTSINASLTASGHGGGAAATGASSNAAKSTHASHLQTRLGTSSTTTAQYLERLSDIRQMDIQSALDQMRTLLSVTRPHTIYKMAYYRKQTKNHWARDDPAFCVLQFIFLVIASIAYAVAFRSSVSVAISFLISTVAWNWLGMGILLASAGREIANRHLTSHQSSSHVRQQVEWLYAFDIHCNAFFPLFVVLCTCQCCERRPMYDAGHVLTRFALLDDFFIIGHL